MFSRPPDLDPRSDRCTQRMNVVQTQGAPIHDPACTRVIAAEADVWSPTQALHYRGVCDSTFTGVLASANLDALASPPAAADRAGCRSRLRSTEIGTGQRRISRHRYRLLRPVSRGAKAPSERNTGGLIPRFAHRHRPPANQQDGRAVIAAFEDVRCARSQRASALNNANRGHCRAGADELATCPGPG